MPGWDGGILRYSRTEVLRATRQSRRDEVERWWEGFEGGKEENEVGGFAQGWVLDGQ